MALNWDDQVWDLVDEAAERLQAADMSAESTDLGQFLPEADEATRRAVLTQLIILDQERRWQGGQRLRLETYLGQWSELLEDGTGLADLVRAECRLRASLGDLPTAGELDARFPAVAAQIDLKDIAKDIAPPSTPHPGDTPDDSDHGTPPQRTRPQWFGPREHLDRYEVREVLGRGGMGEVYRAYDTKLQREVAIKVPRYDPSLEPEVAMRFIREIRATAALRHPNICPVYDADMSEGHYFIVMALISGTDLESRLRTSRPEVGATIRIIAKVARALETAHQAGVVHRDVKPGNILLDDRGEPLLTDFGLCRQFRVEKGTFSQSTLLGTPAYMAPEQAAVQPADYSSDIYSLGVVLFQMLTGALPFSGTAADVLSQVVDHEPPRPRQLRPDLDPVLETICLRAMHRNPRERYGSAGEFAAALEEYAASLARPATRSDDDRRWWLRAAAIAVALLLAAVAVLAYRGLDERRTLQELPQPTAVVERPPEPLQQSDRERRIAELRDEISSFANIETDLARVRRLEKDFLAERTSFFGVNPEAVRGESLRILERLTTYQLTEQEQDKAWQAEALGARTGVLDSWEQVYIPVRQLAEMLDVRLAMLQNELTSLEEESQTPVDVIPPEMPAEFTARIAETQRQLASLPGIDHEIQAVWALATDYYDAQQELFSPVKANTLHYRSFVRLARLKAFDLTEDEQSLVAQAKKIDEKLESLLGIFSDPTDVYIEVYRLADRIHERLELLHARLKGLQSWTPNSREFHILVETLPAEVQIHCDRARLLASRNEWSPAIGELDSAIETSTPNAILFALRAEYQADKGDYGAAIADANRAINLDGRLGYAYFVRGCAQAMRGPVRPLSYIAVPRASRDHLEQAKADYTTAIALDPKLASAYIARADVRLRLEDYDGAIDDCTAVLDLIPPARAFTTASAVRASAWAGKGDFDQALADCDAIIEANPHFPFGYGVLGQIRAQQAEYQKAVEAFTEAIRRGPGLVESYRRRADCYRKLGQEAKAEADERTVQEILDDEQRNSSLRSVRIEGDDKYLPALEWLAGTGVGVSLGSGDGVLSAKFIEALGRIQPRIAAISCSGFQRLRDWHAATRLLRVSAALLSGDDSSSVADPVGKFETLYLILEDNDDRLPDLRGLTRLQHLFLWSEGEKTLDVKPLERLSGLRSLTVLAANAAIRNADVLGSLTELQFLTSISREPYSLPGFSRLPRLQYLKASFPVDTDFAFVERLPYLQTLAILDLDPRQRLESLASAPRLRCLAVRKEALEYRNVDQFHEGSFLVATAVERLVLPSALVRPGTFAPSSRAMGSEFLLSAFSGRSLRATVSPAGSRSADRASLGLSGPDGGLPGGLLALQHQASEAWSSPRYPWLAGDDPTVAPAGAEHYRADRRRACAAERFARVGPRGQRAGNGGRVVHVGAGRPRAVLGAVGLGRLVGGGGKPGSHRCSSGRSAARQAGSVRRRHRSPASIAARRSVHVHQRRGRPRVRGVRRVPPLV